MTLYISSPVHLSFQFGVLSLRSLLGLFVPPCAVLDDRRVQACVFQSLHVRVETLQKLRVRRVLRGVRPLKFTLAPAYVVEVVVHVIPRAVYGQRLHVHLRHQPPALLEPRLRRAPHRRGGLPVVPELPLVVGQGSDERRGGGV
jgi:hypothetical protein